MNDEIGERVGAKDPYAEREIAWMEQYLGRSLASMEELPEDEARRLMVDASKYACCKCAEIEARGHMSTELRLINRTFSVSFAAG